MVLLLCEILIMTMMVQVHPVWCPAKLALTTMMKSCLILTIFFRIPTMIPHLYKQRLTHYYHTTNSSE